MKKTNNHIAIFILLLIFFSGIDQAAGAAGRERDVAKGVVELINRVRARGTLCGKRYFKSAGPVAWNDILGKASLEHSSDMAERNFFGHRGADGLSPGERISRLGYRWITYGENVGEGYRTPEDMVRGWLESEGHCENIMNPAFKEAASAYVKKARKIYWTLLLAAPKR